VLNEDECFVCCVQLQRLRPLSRDTNNIIQHGRTVFLFGN